ncbi:MAG: ferredoxin family protein [Sedimentisphaerales bacterium]|nr:ferredoxin family protein [Sedimentisphaerales bacterium]
MAVVEPAEQHHVVACACTYYDIISKAARERIVTGLREKCPAVEVVPDLCGLAAHRDPRLRTWANEAPLTIVACFPRAVRWLFHAAGVTLNRQARLFNMRTQPPEEIIAQVADCRSRIGDSSHGGNPKSEIADPQSAWVPWFPVIDYDRCHNCKNCLNFCLFGVYALSNEGRVEVRRPTACKTNCPACARMCPHKAIIFPKYADPHINGDEVPAATADSDGTADPQSSDLYERVRQHSAGRKRFARETNDLSPARSCPTLEGLRRELGIPQEVLTSLSPAEIQRITAKSQRNSGQSSARPGDTDRKDGEHNG